MAAETRTTDKKAGVTLPRAFANSIVIFEQVSDTEVRTRKVRVIPEEGLRFAEELRTPLSDRDRDLFLEMLENPPEPTETLRRAVAKYAKRNESPPRIR